MIFTESQQHSVTVLTLTGKLDGLTSGAVERHVAALLTRGTRKLVFDCAQLLYVSSAGLKVFLATAKKFQSAGGAVSFATLTPAVHEAFELCGFIPLLDIHPTVSEAVAKLK